MAPWAFSLVLFDVVGDLGGSAVSAECFDRYSQFARNFVVDALTAGTPSAVLVASDGTVRSAPVGGRVAIESLIRLALQDETRPAGRVS